MSPALEVAAPHRPRSTTPLERRDRLAVTIFRGTPRETSHVAHEDLPLRVLNLSVAVFLLVTLAPLMLVIAAVVRLTSPGPVIYKQSRVGIDRRKPGSEDAGGRRLVDYGGKLFTIYKFRTMSADPHCTVQIWAKPNDARVTRVGRVLRQYRLDELPQLVNVLRGEMNVVGPRPEQPDIFMLLRSQIDGYAERQRVLPGLTGLAQVNQSYDTTVDAVRTKLWCDLEYLRTRSAWNDLRILLRTIPVMVFQRGAW